MIPSRQAISDKPLDIKYITQDAQVGYAVEHLLKFDMLGYDTETYNKFDRHIPAFEPSEGARMRLAQWSTPLGRTYVFDLFKVGPRFLHFMFPNKFLCIIHNAKFELKFLMHEMGIYEFGPMFDTMVAEQVLAKGRVAGKDAIRVGLAPVASRRLKVNLPKEYQNSEWYKEELSREQIIYAARDSQIVMPIQQQQSEILVAQGQVNVAEVEFRATQPIAWMENNGFTMDADQWVQVCDETKKELDEVKAELWKLIGPQNTLFENMPTVSLSSQPKVIAAMQAAGIPVPLNDEGKLTLSKQFLSQLHGRKEVELYMKYAKLDKRMSSYGPNWADKVNPYSGRIHCQLKQIGAETGRMAAKMPNLMQIPKHDDIYRNCFRARDGWVLIDVDYSQCELRILAELCRDPNLLLAYDNEYDLHYFSGHLIYKKAMEEVTKKERGVAKNLNFGIVYGIGSGKFARDAEIAVEDAQEIMDYYLKKAYPSMGQWLETQARQVLHTMTARTMLGRLCQYAGDLRDGEKKSEIQRNAKNHPIQGSNADITKVAMYEVYRDIVKANRIDDIKLILPVHDELIAEAKPQHAMEAKMIVENAMLRAERGFLRRVPCKVDGDLTLKWSKEPTAEMKEAAHQLIQEYV